MTSIREIFSEYRQNYTQEEISATELKNTLGKSTNNIILFGAGSSGIGVLYGLRKIGIEPLAWIDNDPLKWGKSLENLKIENPGEYVKKSNEHTLVILCVNTDGKSYNVSLKDSLKVGGHSAVYKRLGELGYTKITDYFQLWRCYDIFDANPYLVPSCSDVRLMLKSEEEISNAFSLLSDDLSRETFKSILKFRLFGRDVEIPTCPDEERYYAPDIFKYSPDEYLVDCGAYDGRYLDRLLKYSNGFKQYVGFDCDDGNFKLLQEKYDNMDDETKKKSKLYNIALYDRVGELSYYKLGSPGSFVSETGPFQTKCDKMDNILKNEKPTIIKMNMENSELYALSGAEKIIQTNSPILSISNYHRTPNLWKVILKMYEINKSYKCFMRSYMKNLSLVAYAASPERVKS